jgi:uncharacterized protein YceH (UPF0502 family)
MAEAMNLSLEETRVIGVLIEKQITTPDQYPLSLNSLTTGCNQKSNREPVLDLDESVVQETVDELVKQHLVTENSGFGSRVTKLQHRFCNTEFSKLQFDEQELGVICVLLLRGPQTPGELRTRTNRLCKFSDVREVEATLQRLSHDPEKAYVVKLPREPGKRESRYAHLFSGEVDVEAMAEAVSAQVTSGPSAGAGADNDRILALEQQVAQMQSQIEELQEQLLELQTR